MTDSQHLSLQSVNGPNHKNLKCVIWDLDNTLWDGVLLEDHQVKLRDEVIEIIRTLDGRGILSSIASKNDCRMALHQLELFGVRDYFLYPQINWNAKSISIQRIATALNIGLDAIGFVDDQSFELDEVAFALPQVTCINGRDLRHMLSIPELQPKFVTDESRLRRQMYLSDAVRNQAEQEFVGPAEEFLATLGMIFTIRQAREVDLQRAEELTIRTHQLNATGIIYSYEELDEFCRSSNHYLIVAALEDKYGPYGTIGLALVEYGKEIWNIKLLLMSCRVMSRGVGNILLSYIVQCAKEQGVRLQADFVQNDRNRMMYVTFKFSGFKEVDRQDSHIIFEHDLVHLHRPPAYIQVVVES